MVSELGERWQLAGRSAVGTGRHAAASAAAVTRGSAQLIRLACNPPVEVLPTGRWRPFYLPPPAGMRLRARGVVINGLRIDKVDVRAHDIAIRPGSPIAVRARTIVARVRLTEADVNWWLTTAHLPVRLRFTDEGIRARTGLAGVALGSIDVTVALEGGLLRLTPQRVAVLGIGLSTAGFPTTPLPLPPLPRAARLTGIVTAARTVTATLQLPGGSWDVGPKAVRDLLKLARSGRASIGAPPRVRRDAERVGKTPDAVRMVSSSLV
jgi:DUF2993 family protein